MKKHNIVVNLVKTGRTFDGIGGVSSNGTSKLLRDYPEKQQAEILDLLFKPNFGASLQELKLEIGSDANTSSGTEPSHMRTKTDCDITRGVGLWLAQQAKTRNPAIILEALRWGTPGWVSSHQDKLLFYCSYLKEAQKRFNLSFDFLGADMNEGTFDRDWTVNTLRKGLDENGFTEVGLVAADSEGDWFIADLVEQDTQLRESLVAMGIHYTLESPDNAKASGLPIWLSEDIAPFHTAFDQGPLKTAHNMIAMYTKGKMTKFEMHPLLECNYESTPFAYKGILTAVWPWSGHYRIEAGFWMIAHFTQFIFPGWKFIDQACCSCNGFDLITLCDPAQNEVSCILLNTSDQPCQVDLHFLQDFSKRPFHLWHTHEHAQFVHNHELFVGEDHTIPLTLRPQALYTLTTTTGQQKGTFNDIPETTEFPLPYAVLADTDRYQPLYTQDQSGAFEMARTQKGEACIRQVLNRHMIPSDWARRPTPLPYTLLGSMNWANYRVSATVLIEDSSGYAMIGGRANLAPKSADGPQAYTLTLYSNGHWEMKRAQQLLLSGLHDALKGNLWIKASITFNGSQIQAYIHDALVGTVTDSVLSSGQAVLGTDYVPTQFKDVLIERLENQKTYCVRIDDHDKRINYSSSFVGKFTGYQAFFRTVTEAVVPGAQMNLSFTGSGISIIAEKGPNCGTAVIYVDDMLFSEVDTYSPICKYRESIFSLFDLQPGQHTLTLKVAEITNINSTGTAIRIDALEIIET